MSVAFFAPKDRLEALGALISEWREDGGDKTQSSYYFGKGRVYGLLGITKDTPKLEGTGLAWSTVDPLSDVLLDASIPLETVYQISRDPDGDDGKGFVTLYVWSDPGKVIEALRQSREEGVWDERNELPGAVIDFLRAGMSLQGGGEGNQALIWLHSRV
jgi:hypothetical protein